MKKLFVIMTICLAAVTSCTKPFKSSIDLAVNNTRVNITAKQASEQFQFVFPVYCSGDWTARIVAGGEWFSMDCTSGRGDQYVNCTCEANTVNIVRAVKVEFSSGNKTIPVYFVVSSTSFNAADIPDAELDNYLI